MAASHSAQDMVRPGDCVDLYYYDGETSKKQCFPTTQNTKYSTAFTNPNGGTSVFTIPPQNGVQDVVLSFKTGTFGSTLADQEGVALPRGWGYSVIKSVSFRYGGSSQYFLTGDQILQAALRKQPSRQTADDLFTLGGNFATGADLSGNHYASVVLTLPHSSPSGVGKANPLPSDCLTQQIQVTCELYPLSQVLSVAAGNAGAASLAAAASMASASFTVQQVMFNNQGDALPRRVDMATNAYSFPCDFIQQVQRIQLASGAADPQSAVLTGFRSGEVKSVLMWLTRLGDNPQSKPVAGAINNPFKWYLPDSVVMTYAGDIYANYNSQSSPLWNLINSNKAPAVDNVLCADAGGGNIESPPAQWLSQWVELPFAQTLVDEDAHKILSHGKPITNGIVNLQVALPEAEVDGTADWVLNVSYLYNATLLFSQGTCDYVF